MPAELLMMILFLIGFYIAVSKTLNRYNDTDLEQAASLALLEEPQLPPDSRRF
ncbi:hypothetical protein [Pseudomonas sp. MYb185]|uniref:hypothetical protein n=1 Tax=Pseudomonas sp. MYb185 TaxID=1848729 RepID=UPI00130494D5|nr:hypothetical protein [Pseudomonas sp. MYb185]